MINTKFEVYKITREIKRSGQAYLFIRPGTNKFGEHTTSAEQVVSIQGLYHEQSSNIEITTGDTTQVRTEKIPMILCVYSEVVGRLQVGDNVMIAKDLYKVTGAVDVQNWQLIVDISLELVDAGKVLRAT